MVCCWSKTLKARRLQRPWGPLCSDCHLQWGTPGQEPPAVCQAFLQKRAPSPRASRGNLLSLHPEGCFVLLLFPEASSSSCSDSCAATRALLNICTVSATELWQMWVMITSEAHQKRKHMRLWHYSAGSNLCLIIYWPKKFNKKYVL